MIKIKAWQDSREIIINVADLITLGQLRRRHMVKVEDMVNSTIELDYQPLELSEEVYVNGLMMSNGVDLDYTLSGNLVTFNVGVLTQSGNVLINYYSL